MKIFAFLDSEILYGKERSNIEVYDVLKNNGYDVIVLANNKASDTLKKELSRFTVIYLDYFTFKGNFISLVNLFKFNFYVNGLIKKHKPITILNPSQKLFYVLFPCFFSMKKDIIFRVGDKPLELKKYPVIIKKIHDYFWRSFIVNKIGTIVSISKYIELEIYNSGRKNNNNYVIYNYPPKRIELDDENNEIYLKKGQRLVFGYIGRIVQDKGVHLFIEAAMHILKENRNREFIFYIAGSLTLDKEYSEKILSTISPEYLDNIIFLGEIHNISKFFSNIDVLCVPSIYQEPLGNIIVEAKEYGKPSVIFKSGGMPELIHHKQDGFISTNFTFMGLVEGMQYYFDENNLQSNSIESKKSIERLRIDYTSFKTKWLNVVGKYRI